MCRPVYQYSSPRWRLGLSLLAGSLSSALALPRLTSECPAGFRGRIDSVGFTECAVPIDDATTSEDPASWAPWTHRPVCLNSTVLSSRGENGERLPGIPEPTRSAPVKFCVYTNVHLGESGLSIITTPEHAASSLYLLENPNLRLSSRERVSSHTAAGKHEPPQPLYEVVDMPGRGKGVVATRRIRRFEPIMLEPGAIVTDTQFPRVIKRQDGYRLLHEAVDRLGDPGRIMSLAQSSPFAQDVVEDILRINSFAAELDGEPHMALFPRVARINHACKPNAYVRFAQRSIMTAVVAGRDIAPGEEITITYSSFGMHYEERQERLQTVWGFKCTCAACTASEADRTISDQRLKDVQQKRREIIDAVDRADAATAIRLSHDVLDLLAHEDLPALFAEEYELLARVYNLVGRTDLAVKYARMALKVLDLYGTLDRDGQYDELERILRLFEVPKESTSSRPPIRDHDVRQSSKKAGSEGV